MNISNSTFKIICHFCFNNVIIDVHIKCHNINTKMTDPINTYFAYYGIVNVTCYACRCLHKYAIPNYKYAVKPIYANLERSN